jgi:hypothetical protein
MTTQKQYRYRIVLEQVVEAESREQADAEHHATLASLGDRDDVKIVDRHVYAARKVA